MLRLGYRRGMRYTLLALLLMAHPALADCQVSWSVAHQNVVNDQEMHDICEYTERGIDNVRNVSWFGDVLTVVPKVRTEEYLMQLRSDVCQSFFSTKTTR